MLMNSTNVAFRRGVFAFAAATAMLCASITISRPEAPSAATAVAPQSAYPKVDDVTEAASVLATIAQLAYHPESVGPDNLPAGWTLVDRTNARDYPDGFKAIAVRHVASGKVVVAFAGTNVLESSDLRADLQIGLHTVVSGIYPGDRALQVANRHS